MKKIRLLINTIRFSLIVGIVILVFIGERSRIMAMFGGIFLLLSVVEFILQFLTSGTAWKNRIASIRFAHRLRITYGSRRCISAMYGMGGERCG